MTSSTSTIEINTDGEPKLNGATVPYTMSPLDTLKAKYAQEVANELAGLDWAGNPAGSAVKLGEITTAIHTKAEAELATAKKAESEKADTLNKTTDAARATGLMTFTDPWKSFEATARKLPHVKVWTFQVQVDETKEPRQDGSVYYQDATFIAGYAKKAKVAGSTSTRTTNPTARQPVYAKLKDDKEFTKYTSAADFKVKVLGIEGPMNKATVLEKAVEKGYEIKA